MYATAGVYPDFVGEVQMDRSADDNRYDLTVLSVEEVDAGTYVAGFALAADYGDAQLVVLGMS